MKVGIPIAAYCEGTTGEYVVRALRQLGHEAEILSQWSFYDSFRVGEHDFYFCVDSGGPLNLFEPSIQGISMRNLCFWMIDYRRGKHLKNPSDEDTCRLILERGGIVFQSQHKDVLDSLAELNLSVIFDEHIYWLPLAADPDVWSSSSSETKRYDVGFVGNVWDPARSDALDLIRRAGLTCTFKGHGASYMEEGAELLRSARVGFNISSHFYDGSSVNFDVNMRVFETLSCGIPLVTNDVPSLKLLFGNPLPKFIRTYRDVSEIPNVLISALADSEFVVSGPAARQWILDNATYVHRVKKVLDGR